MRIFIIILLFICSNVNSQSTKGTYHDLLRGTTISPPALKAFTLDTIPYSALDLLTPFRGANTFYTNTQAVNIPDPATNIWSIDNETRFNWGELQNGVNSYTWANFDNQINTSISRRQAFRFRIVPLADSGPGVIMVGGAAVGYPVFVHNLMQAGNPKDWIYSIFGNPAWIPNWNSTAWLTNMETFLLALRDHINTTSSPSGVPYKNVVRSADVGFYGNYGEWHTYPWRDCGCIPAGTGATATTLTRIIVAHATAFPTIPLLGNVDMFSGEIPGEIGYYILTASSGWGRYGLRGDHMGWTASYNGETTDPRSFNGLVFSQQSVQQYKFAPFVGEPMNDATLVTTGGPCAFWHMETEVRGYHYVEWNNQNGTGVNSACLQTNYRNSSKASGYRWQIMNGTISNNIPSGSNLQTNIIYRNGGITPTYETWNVRIDLRNAGGTVVWFGQSSFLPKLVLPGTNPVVTDNFTLPALPAGVYSVNVSWIDPLGYRNPMPLYNTVVRADGSYQLTTINII